MQPWRTHILEEWNIVGMNHYHIDGTKRLFVAMTKDGMCVQVEGPDTDILWEELQQKAIKATIGRDIAQKLMRV